MGSYACVCSTGYERDGSNCFPICGDGVKVTQEACDDGNVAVGDGCSAACTVEPHFVCAGGDLTRGDLCTCAPGRYPLPPLNDELAGESDVSEELCSIECSQSVCGGVGSCHSTHGYCVCPRFYLGMYCEVRLEPSAGRYCIYICVCVCVCVMYMYACMYIPYNVLYITYCTQHPMYRIPYAHFATYSYVHVATSLASSGGGMVALSTCYIPCTVKNIVYTVYRIRTKHTLTCDCAELQRA
jgi:cysteine-rich repeat protein